MTHEVNAGMSIALKIRQLLENADVDRRIKSPYLHEAEICARNGAPYAAINMLGLCAEAYLRLLVRELGTPMMKYFGEKQFDKKFPNKRKRKDGTRRKVEELNYMDLIWILNRMKLLPMEKDAPLSKDRFELLANVRNDFAHPSWKSPDDSLIDEYLKNLEPLISLPLKNIRFNSADELLEYMQEQNFAPLNSSIRWIPIDSYSDVAKTILDATISDPSSDRLKLRDFWFRLKKDATYNEEVKIEEYFVTILKNWVDKGNSPDELVYFIDWNGSEYFCDQCANLLLGWIEKETKHQSEDRLDLLDGFCQDLQEKIPASFAERLAEAKDNIQERL